MFIDGEQYTAYVSGGEVLIKKKTLNRKAYDYALLKYNTTAVSAEREDVEKLAELILKCGRSK